MLISILVRQNLDFVIAFLKKVDEIFML